MSTPAGLTGLAFSDVGITGIATAAACPCRILIIGACEHVRVPVAWLVAVGVAHKNIEADTTTATATAASVAATSTGTTIATQIGAEAHQEVYTARPTSPTKAAFTATAAIAAGAAVAAKSAGDFIVGNCRESSSVSRTGTGKSYVDTKGTATGQATLAAETLATATAAATAAGTDIDAIGPA